MNLRVQMKVAFHQVIPLPVHTVLHVEHAVFQVPGPAVRRRTTQAPKTIMAGDKTCIRPRRPFMHPDTRAARDTKAGPNLRGIGTVDTEGVVRGRAALPLAPLADFVGLCAGIHQNPLQTH